MAEVSYCFSVGDTRIGIQLPHCMEVEPEFVPFLMVSGEYDVQVRFEPTDSVSRPTGERIESNHWFDAYRSEGKVVRIYRRNDTSVEPHALGIQETADTFLVRYLRDKVNMVDSAKDCFSLIPLDDVLITQGKFILHASLVDSVFGGILFCGASGAGKSTQAELWRTYENACVINGDRPIIGKVNGKWRGYGSPYAGSSRYHVNRNVPITAICMVEKAPRCAIHKYGKADAFRKLLSCAVMNVWNQSYTHRILDLITHLAEDIPVYRLECTPDQNAVETVKEELIRKGSAAWK